MSENIPITVGVWSKRSGAGAGWGKVSEVRTWRDLSLEPRFMQVGPWSLRLPFDAQSARITKKHLLTFDFRGTRMTGVVEKIGPRGDETGKPTLELSGADALTLLGDVLCWPNPAAALGSQGVGWYFLTGAAETALRSLILANATRRGDDWAIPTSLGRGATVNLAERFTNLATVVLTKAEVAGLGVRMGLADTSSSTRAAMTVEFFTPVDRSNRVRLSHKVGTLRTWRQEDNAPTGTRAIVAGFGGGATRLFRSVTPTTALAAETEWGRKREVFVDGGTEASTTKLDEQGTEALLQAASQSAFELETAEAEGMRYGVHYGLGDKVTVELLTGVSKVDTLRSVVLTASVSEGLTVRAVPGNPDATNPLFGQAAIVRGIRRQVQALERKEP